MSFQNSLPRNSSYSEFERRSYIEQWPERYLFDMDFPLDTPEENEKEDLDFQIKERINDIKLNHQVLLENIGTLKQEIIKLNRENGIVVLAEKMLPSLKEYKLKF